MEKKHTMQIFTDADFFIGLYLNTDPHYKKCILLAENITEDLITSYDVVDETFTKLTYIGSKKIALNFINDLKKNNIVINYVTTLLFNSAITIYLLQSSKHVSLTDCMNMAIMKEKGIKKVLSFDKIYEQNGFELVK